MILALIAKLAALIAVVSTDSTFLPLADPTKDVVVELFEWKYSDVANECENFLSNFGYGAVQVSPAAEHIRLTQANGNMPWWIKYQPVSYKICSRNGDQAAFEDMVNRCNAVGVRVISNVVTNHMSGMNAPSPGWCGSQFSAADHAESYPAVPYGANDFNDPICDKDISDYDNAWEVRKCRLVSLLDLNQDHDYVRQKITGFLNSLVSLGVAGIRVDAAKHQYPEHLGQIFSGMNNLNSNIFGNNVRPFVVQEVIDMNSGEAVHAADYVGNGRVTNFIYGQKISDAVRRNNNFKYFGNFGEAWGIR